MSNKALLLRTLRLWHRRISLFLLVWVFFVALTGIGLNHSEDFGLDSVPLPTVVLQRIYDVAPPDVKSFYLEGSWISLVGGHQLYRNSKAIGLCDALAGLATYANEIYIGCGDSVFLISPQGEIIEQLTARFGLPVPISDFGSCANLPCLVSNGKTFVLNPQQFNWQPADSAFIPLPQGVTPEGLKTSLQRENTPQDFHLERLVRDLHSGLFFGLGPWLMDLFAIALMVLTATGFAMWWMTRRN